MTSSSPLSSTELDAYLARIGHSGPVGTDLPTLVALHRAHAAAIAFENLDVQLGDPPGRDPARIFDKLVTRRRGGWCYEQNGLFARALAALGFAVTPLSAGVMRQERGEAAMGSHLCLKVTLDGTEWLADVGFGASLLEPMPLAPHAWDHGVLAGTLAPLDDGYWRMAITYGPMPLSYDFINQPANETELDALCHWQGRDAESMFVQNLVVQQRRADSHLMLRGKVLTRTGPQSETRELGSAEELVSELRETFDLDLPEAARLWDAVEARHAELFAAPAS